LFTLKQFENQKSLFKTTIRISFWYEPGRVKSIAIIVFIFFNHFKQLFMKRTLTLIALFTLMAATSEAQSALEIRNSVANVAPSTPTLARYSGTGQVWPGRKVNYTMESRDNIKAWIKANPKEASDFKAVVGPYMGKTDATKLSKEDAETYYDLQAIYSIVAQSPELNGVPRQQTANTK